MPWQPLLEGALRDSARQSVRAILADLESRGREPFGDPSLAGGTAGLAVLYGYLAQTGQEPESDARARRCLQHATAAMAEQPETASLYSGLAGVGGAMAHLGSRWPDWDEEDDLAEIDEIVLEHLDQSPWRGEYDLIDLREVVLVIAAGPPRAKMGDCPAHARQPAVERRTPRLLRHGGGRVPETPVRDGGGRGFEPGLSKVAVQYGQTCGPASQRRVAGRLSSP